MDDLLKEAIADAKAVRETALENAKMALEEAFTPKLKSMLAQKIQAEIEDEGENHDEVEDEGYGDEDMEDEMHHGEVEDEVEDEGEHGGEEAPAEEPEEDEVEEISHADEEEVEEVHDEEDEEKVDEVEDEVEDKVDEVEDEDDDMDEELDLESILAELEAEIKEEDEEDKMDEVNEVEDEGDEEKVDENDVSSDIGKADNKLNAKANDSSETGAQGPEGEGKDEPAGKELDDHEVVKEGEEEKDEVDEEIDLEEVLKALSEEEDEDETKDEVVKLQAEVKEHRDVVKYLREKLNEVNLLNAKLLFSNKLFRAFGLSNEQKLKVVETFDRTKNLREIKLVYSTLAESFRGVKAAPIAESKGSSSKAVASTKPVKEEVISEGAELKNRFKKLANIL